MYNHSEIAKEAWAIARRFEYTREPLKTRLARGMRCAWDKARANKVVQDRVIADMNYLAAINGESLEWRITSLENRTYLNPAEDRLLSELHIERLRRVHLAQRHSKM